MNEKNTHESAPARESAGSSMAIPLAIVLGFGLIALSIYLSGGKEAVNAVAQPDEQQNANIENLAPVTAEDHIRGNPNAPLVIVEYSDFDCPFCKSFHVTMQKIIEEYGPSGKVAWVYRHLPLTSLHPSAAYIAEASECVAELGGNDAFWKFSDMVFGERGPNELTNLAALPEYAVSAGVDGAAYEECVESGRNQAKVQEDMENAQLIGVQGTPHSIVVAGDQKMVISGAQPYENVKLLIDGLAR